MDRGVFSPHPVINALHSSVVLVPTVPLLILNSLDGKLPLAQTFVAFGSTLANCCEVRRSLRIIFPPSSSPAWSTWRNCRSSSTNSGVRRIDQGFLQMGQRTEPSFHVWWNGRWNRSLKGRSKEKSRPPNRCRGDRPNRGDGGGFTQLEEGSKKLPGSGDPTPTPGNGVPKGGEKRTWLDNSVERE